MPPTEKVKNFRLAQRLHMRAWRLAAAGLAAGGLLGLASLAAPWLHSATSIRDSVAVRLQAASGLYFVTRGDARMALLPRPHVALGSVVLADRNGALRVEAAELVGALNLPTLLTGRLEVSSVRLVRPRIELDLDKTVDAPGAAVAAAATRSATPGALAADRALLGVLSLADGSAQLKNGGRVYTLNEINVSLDWRRVGEPLALTGAFEWRGEKIEALLWVARPGALLRGGETIATARLDGANLTFEAQGQAQAGPNARFTGHVAASAASARYALQLLDLSPRMPGPLAEAQFTAQAVIALKKAEFQDLCLFADGNEFRGSAALRHDEGRINLTANLRSDFVSAKAMLAEAPTLIASDGQWTREPFETSELTGVDADLRLATAHARLGRLVVDDSVFTMTLREGSLDLARSEARAYNGSLKLRAALARDDKGISLRTDVQTANLDAGALLRDAFGRRAVSGALDATLTLDAAGADMPALMRSLKGRVTAALSDGDIDGLDLERAMRRLEQRPLASALDIRMGRTTLDKATATILIDNGVAEVKDGKAHGPGYALDFSAAADMSERMLELRAFAHADNQGAGRPDKEIDFSVAGGWDDLQLTTDARAFIRRSDAAAPLLPSEPATKLSP